MEKNNDRMLQFFKYKHLPDNLQEISKPFCELAEKIVETLPRTPERTVTLRKLLESKDCAVRTVLDKAEVFYDQTKESAELNCGHCGGLMIFVPQKTLEKQKNN